jgi:hypothetical protein
MGAQPTPSASRLAHQPEQQTLAASAAPRMGQEKRGKKKSAYKRYLSAHAKTAYGREAGYRGAFRGSKRRTF